MRFYKYKLLMLICIIFCGCASANAKTYKDTKIEKEDGINSGEAAVIARVYVENDSYYKEYYLLSRPKVKDSVLRKNCWAVEFKPNIKGVFNVFYPLQISIDKSNGEIKGAGTTK